MITSNDPAEPPKVRAVKTAEERAEKRDEDVQAKRKQVVADDEAIDRMIRRNIEQHGA